MRQLTESLDRPAKAHCLGIDIGGAKVVFRGETDSGCVDGTAFAWALGRSASLDLVRLARQVDEVGPNS
ncbi:hypothetical protein ACJ6WF_00740 [Streptomyces sp. MMS24-I2-30]|uniref:hypothetical protein n=1 Tax=Streptomyces sp. MMS24-I2-30 TaxID=3351564 RepID=UPI00389691CC